MDKISKAKLDSLALKEANLRLEMDDEQGKKIKLLRVVEVDNIGPFNTGYTYVFSYAPKGDLKIVVGPLSFNGQGEAENLGDNSVENMKLDDADEINKWVESQRAYVWFGKILGGDLNVAIQGPEERFMKTFKKLLKVKQMKLSADQEKRIHKAYSRLEKSKVYDPRSMKYVNDPMGYLWGLFKAAIKVNTIDELIL